MKEKVEEKLGEGELLIGMTGMPYIFCIVKREHEQFPFIIRGFCHKREEFFDKYLACSNQDVATQKLQELLKKAIFLSQVMR